MKQVLDTLGGPIGVALFIGVPFASLVTFFNTWVNIF